MCLKFNARPCAGFFRLEKGESDSGRNERKRDAMNTYKTMNPVGSKSPKDLSDNASGFDEVMTSPLPWFENRLGKKLLTLAGQQFEIDEAIRGIGYIRIGDYDDGPLTITLPNQIFSKNGEFWISDPSLDLPYTTVENWVVDEPNFNPVGDALLRQELASTTGSSRVGFKHTSPGSIGTNLQQRGSKTVLPGDFASLALAAQAVIDAGLVYLGNQETFTITVGPGGTCATIGAAIAAASRMRPTFINGQGACVILLKNGYVMREQVLLKGGQDLGWIRIQAEAALVTIDPAYITEYLSAPDNSMPAFGAMDNSTLPIIGCKFQYADNFSAKDGVAVLRNSRVLFDPETGVVRARRGLLVFGGSHAACYPLGLTQGGGGTGAGTTKGVDFSYARLRGLHVAYGSTAALARSMLHNCEGDFGAYIIWGSHVSLYQSNASSCVNGTAFHARDGSTLDARESNGARSQRGFHALHRGSINARSRLTGDTMIWVGEGAQFCTQYAVLASYNSSVEAADLNANGCIGSAAISASDASSISFIDGTAKNCSSRAVWSVRASNVSAAGTDVSGSRVGYQAEAATIAARGSVANNCPDFGAVAMDSGTISIPYSSLTGCGRAVEARDGSNVNSRGSNMSGAAERAVSCIDGGEINATRANCSGSGSRGITSRDGGRVMAVGADCSGAGDWAVEVLNGSFVTFNEGVVGSSDISEAVNTLTPNGIIFR